MCLPLRLRERPAGPAPLSRNLVKVGLQAAVFWVVFLGVIPTLLVRVEQALRVPAMSWAACGPLGLVLFLVGSVLALRSDYIMVRDGEGTPFPLDASRRLVVSGPYAHVRNPMALSAVVQFAGVSLFLRSVLVLACAAAGGLVWNYVIRPWEEASLADRYGEPFRRYRRAVKCWIPRLRPYGSAARTPVTRSRARDPQVGQGT